MTENNKLTSDSSKIGYIQGVLLALKTLYRDDIKGETALKSLDTAYEYACELGTTVMIAEVERNVKKKMEAKIQGEEETA
jgi:hypothetical protein